MRVSGLSFKCAHTDHRFIIMFIIAIKVTMTETHMEPPHSAASLDYRTPVGPFLKDTTPSRQGRLITKIPGTDSLLAVPQAYVPLCRFHTVTGLKDLPSMHLVYFACAIRNVNTYPWIEHTLGRSAQFDTVSIVFQCRGVIAKAQAERDIADIVSKISHPSIQLFVYDDPPIH